MSDPKAPLPRLEPMTEWFWEACRRGALEVAACDDCGHRFLPPGPCCPRCWCERVSPRELSGHGSVFSFAVYRRTYHPAIPAPYVVALVELEEGPRLISNIVGCAPEEVTINMEVQVRFEEVGDFTLPRFVPLSGSEGKR